MQNCLRIAVDILNLLRILIETELLEVTLMINENNTIKAKNKLIDIRNKLMKRNEINCDVFLDTKIKIANSNQLNLYKGLYSLAAQIFYDDYESSHDKNILKKSMHYYHMAILLSNQISVHSQREKSALLHQLSSEGLKMKRLVKQLKAMNTTTHLNFQNYSIAIIWKVY